MEWLVVGSTDGSLEPQEAGARLEADKVVGEGGHGGLLDCLVARARGQGKLGRRLLLPPGDLGLVLRLLLQRAGRQLGGNYSGTAASELIELELRVGRIRAGGGWPEDGEDRVGRAAGLYRAFLKENGLVDRWEAASLGGAGPCRAVVWGLEPGEADLLAGAAVSLVTVVGGEVTSRPTDPEAAVAAALARPGTAATELAGPAAFLRLLVCPKDSIALAAACTSSGLLSPAQFAEVRREAERERMPPFPAIVSFVRKVGLGGRSYQPEEGNGLFQFLPSLVEFNRIMEKLQTKLEEVAGPEAAVRAVMACLAAWLEKQGAPMAEESQAALEERLVEAGRRLAKLEATPAKGLGRQGGPAMKLVTCLLDLLAAADSGPADPTGRTPARQAGLVRLLRTPSLPAAAGALDSEPGDAMDELVADGAVLSERLGACLTPIARPAAFPRFRSAANNFTEGSPALAGSADRGVRTGGRTLAAASGPLASPDTSDQSVREILAEVRAAAEQEEEEAGEKGKKVKKTKRCLAKDVEAAARERLGLGEAKRKASEEGPEGKEKKQPAKKKKFSTPKGQRKLTSFFMR